MLRGTAERIGLQHGRLRIELRGRLFLDKETVLPTYEKAVQVSLAALEQAFASEHWATPIACVHRVVHGGPRLIEPVLITENVKRELESVKALAPLHILNELVVIETVVRTYPNIPQVACFDTAFHQRMPEIAKRLPLPRQFWEAGVRRYGFHGLSYESIVSQLGKQLSGRSIIAHLGNGCSMVALRDSIPQDTTMGLTPTGGLMMGTRSGDLDPGVLFYLLRKSTDAARSSIGSSIVEVEQILNDESGLLGVSGISRNMEDLLRAETESSEAREAIDLFCYYAKKFIGSLYSVLGGLDTLVFTGGMGENSAVVRKRICEGLNFLDIRLDPIRNKSNAPIISHEQSCCTVRTLHTNENLIMARHAFRLSQERPIMSLVDNSVIWEMIIFDWDGTAVPDRHAPIGDLRAALEDLLKEGGLCAIVTGTNLDNILKQGIAELSPLAKHGLHICTNRGSEVFDFGSVGKPQLIFRRQATQSENRALDSAAIELHDWIKAQGMKTEIIFNRLNRRKVDLIPEPEWRSPKKAQFRELLSAVEDTDASCRAQRRYSKPH